MARMINFHKFGRSEDNSKCVARLKGRLLQEVEEHAITKKLLNEALEEIQHLKSQLLEERRYRSVLEQLFSTLPCNQPVDSTPISSMRLEKSRRRWKNGANGAKRDFQLRKFQSSLPYQQVRRKTRYARLKKLRAAIINYIGKKNGKLCREIILMLEKDVGRIVTNLYTTGRHSHTFYDMSFD